MEVVIQQSYGYKTILKTALPLLLSLVLEQIIGLTDVAFLGHYGEIELAAAALSTVFFLVLLMQGYGYSIGSQALMAQANGRKSMQRIGVYFRQSAIFLVGFGIFLWGVTQCVFPWIQAHVIEDPQIGVAVDDYLFWRTVGLPISFLCLLIRAFYIATLRSKVITVSAIVMVLTNVVFNYLLIFGWGPIPSMGIAGAAIASTISEVAALGYFLYKLRQEKDDHKYELTKDFRWDGALQKKLFCLGRWLMLQEALSFGAWFFFFVAVEHLGSTSLGVANVVRQAGSVLFLFIHAFGTTCGSLAANLYGAGHYDAIRPVAWRGMLLSILFVVPLCLLYAFFPQTIFSIFTNLEDIKAVAEPTFYVMLIGYVAAIPCYHYYFILGAIGMTKESSITSLIATAGYILYIFCLPYLSQDVAFYWTTDWLFAFILGWGAYYYWKNVSWKDVQLHTAHE